MKSRNVWRWMGLAMLLSVGCDDAPVELAACAHLDEATCGARADCALERSRNCAGELGILCMDRGRPCGALMTCARPADASDGGWFFSSTCIPEGWANVDYVHCECEARCPTLDDDACLERPDCRVDQASTCEGDRETFCVDTFPTCAQALTCGRPVDAASGGWIFDDDCLPQGWVEVDYESCACAEACREVDEVTCEARTDCWVEHGGNCEGDRQFACLRYDSACGEAITCARPVDAASGGWTFGSTCIPEGWMEVNNDNCWCPQDCWGLGLEDCDQWTHCRTEFGISCDGDVPTVCLGAHEECGETITCGRPIEASAGGWSFNNTCMPQGWAEVDGANCECPAK